jgi:hypothetical protein
VGPPINKSFLEKCMGDETGMEDEVIPFEVERPKKSAHHTETISLRLESLCATLSDSFTDVPRAAENAHGYVSKATATSRMAVVWSGRFVTLLISSVTNR